MTGFSSHAEDTPKSLETDTKASSGQLENASKSPKRSAVPDMLFKLDSPRKERIIPPIPKEHIILRFDESGLPVQK